MSGAMDICKAVDGGEVTTNGDVESCCGQERTEYDDGIEIEGPEYCVSCVIGTDWCFRSDMTRSRQETLRNLKKALSITPKQGTVTGN